MFRFLLLSLYIFGRSLSDPVSDALPGMQLTNWADSVLQFRNNRDSLQENPKQVPGPYEYRISSNYLLSSISSDTFAVKTGTSVYGEDSTLWETHSTVSQSGLYTTKVDSYGETALPFTLTVDYVFPPYYPYYLVRYTIENPTDDEIEGYLLDVIDLASGDSIKPQTKFNNSVFDVPTSAVDLTGEGKESFGHGILSQSVDAAFDAASATYLTGETGSSTSPLVVFCSGDGTFNNSGDSTIAKQTMGISVPFKIAAKASASIGFFRALRSTPKSLSDVVNSAQKKSFDAHNSAAEKEYSLFLKKAKTLKTATEEQKDLFYKSLVFMKNAINPNTGAIAGNFHPTQISLCRPREGGMIALSFAQAGYFLEAAEYFAWLSKVELISSDGASCFASAYNFWNSEPDTTIPTPQYDGATLFLMGSYLLYQHVETRSYLLEMQTRIQEITKLLQITGYDDLFAADYSMWDDYGIADESQPLLAYNAWTQAFAYSGLMTASRLQKYYFRDADYAEKLRRRALTLHNAILKNFVKTVSSENMTFSSPSSRSPATNGEDEAQILIYRRLIGTTAPTPDEVADASTFAFYFLGLLGAPSSSHPSIQIPPIKTPFARNHYFGLLDKLLPKEEGNVVTDTERAVGRYANDELYHNTAEASTNTPAWPAATAYALWAEIALGIRGNIPRRLAFLSDISHGLTAGHGQDPVGRAVNWNGELIWSAAPDVSGHAALYVWSFLLSERKAAMFNPLTWNADGVL